MMRTGFTGSTGDTGSTGATGLMKLQADELKPLVVAQAKHAVENAIGINL